MKDGELTGWDLAGVVELPAANGSGPPVGPEFAAIVEGVGGATLGAAIQRVAAWGAIVSFASTDQAPVQFPTRAFFGRAPGARLHGLFVFPQLRHERTGARDLARLVE